MASASYNDDAMDQSGVEVYAKRRKLSGKRGGGAAKSAKRGAKAIYAGKQSRAATTKLIRRIISDDKEDKWIAISANQQSCSTGVTLTQLSSTLQLGDEHYNREGERVRFTSVIWSGRCDVGDYDNVIRYGIVEFDQNSGNALTGPDIYDSNLFTSGFVGSYLLPQDKNMKGETGLYDRVKWVSGPHTMVLQTAAQFVVTDTATRHPFELFNGKAKLNGRATWNTADVCQGKVYYFVHWSDSGAVTHPTISYNMRLFFQDS